MTHTYAGENAYPETDWGEGHLVLSKGSSASAKFSGGGSIDVPIVCSSIEVKTPIGRAYWEMRIEKSRGLLKFGLGNFDDEAPGDSGLKLGYNWTDRRGNGCTWYLQSDTADTFEGAKCLFDGPPGFQKLQVLNPLTKAARLHANKCLADYSKPRPALHLH